MGIQSHFNIVLYWYHFRILKSYNSVKKVKLQAKKEFIDLVAILDTIFFHTDVRHMRALILLLYNTLLRFYDSFKRYNNVEKLYFSNNPFFIVHAAILNTIFFHINVRLMGISFLLQYDTLVTF